MKIQSRYSRFSTSVSKKLKKYAQNWFRTVCYVWSTSLFAYLTQLDHLFDYVFNLTISIITWYLMLKIFLSINTCIFNAQEDLGSDALRTNAPRKMLSKKCSLKQNAPRQNAFHQNAPQKKMLSQKNAPQEKMPPFKMLPEKKCSPQKICGWSLTYLNLT